MNPGAPASDLLTVDLCRTFAAIIANDGSLLRAARELGESNVTLSKRIRPLLDGAAPALPRPWLTKRGRAFQLTREGQQMLPLARELAERWQNLVERTGARPREGVTVACGQEAAGGVVLAAATAFRRAHPQAAFSVAVVRSRQRLEGLARGQFDLALVTATRQDALRIANRKLALHDLGDDELRLACGSRSPWAAAFAEAKPATHHDLLTWPLVLPEADAAIRQQFDAKLRKQTPEPPTVAIEVGGWNVLRGYVLANFGVGLLPASQLANEPKLRSRPLPPTLRPSNHLLLATLPHPANADLVAAFVSILTAAK